MTSRLAVAFPVLAGLGLFCAGLLLGLRSASTATPATQSESPTRLHPAGAAAGATASANSPQKLDNPATALLALPTDLTIDWVDSVTTRRLLDEITPEEAPAVLEQLVAKHSKHVYLIQALTACWASADPAAALAWARGVANVDHRHVALTAVLGTWAETDPTAARAVVDTLQGAALRSSALQAIALSIADHDPAAGIALLQSAGGRSEQWTLANLVALQASHDLGAALRTIDALPAHISRPLLNNILQMSLCEEAPELAANLALTFPPSSSRQQMINEAMTVLAIENPAAAIDWIIASLRTDEDRRGAVAAAIDKIAADSPSTAIAQLSKLTGPAREVAIAALVPRWAATDPAAAAQWAALLPDEAVRTRSLVAVASHWARQTPRAAMEFARAQPAETRARLLQTVAEIWSRNDAAGAQATAAQLPDGPERAAFTTGLVGRPSN